MNLPLATAILSAALLMTAMPRSARAGDGTMTTQYNLRKLIDTLYVKLQEDGNKTRDKLGENKFRLLTGDEYVVDPETNDPPTFKIKVEDTAYMADQAFYDLNSGFKLCEELPASPVLFDSLTISSDRPATSPAGRQDATHKIFTLVLSRNNIIKDIFPEIGGVRAPYRKMSLCVKLNTRFAEYFDTHDKIKVRPIPMFTILFKNAAALRDLYDSRNSKVCEATKHRSIHVDTFSDSAEVRAATFGHSGPTETKTSSGHLRVYTPNHRTVQVENAFACRAHLYQMAFTCTDNAWAPSLTWLQRLEEQVDPEECARWRLKRQCTIFSANITGGGVKEETVHMSQTSAHQFRSNVTDHAMYNLFDAHVKKHIMPHCVNRIAGKIYVRNCILDEEVPVTYSAPFQATSGGKRLVTPFGSVKADHFLLKQRPNPLSKKEATYGKTKDSTYGWVHINNVGHHLTTLMWTASDSSGALKNSIDDTNICPFTLLYEMPVHSIITSNLQYTDMGLSHGNKVKQVITFVEQTADSLKTPHKIKVYDNQRMRDDDVIRMELNPENKCMYADGNIHQTYMSDRSVLVQFTDNSQIKPTLRSNSWNRSKQKFQVPPPLGGELGIHGLKGQGSSRDATRATDIFEATCSGIQSSFVDKYEHTWTCIHGMPTLTKLQTTVADLDAFVPKVNPDAPVSTAFSSLYTGGFYIPSAIGAHLAGLTGAEKKTMNVMVTEIGRLYNHIENTRAEKMDIFEKVSSIEPDLISKMLFPDHHIKVTRAGDYWAVHRCVLISWRDVRVIPSLRIDHAQMPLPEEYRKTRLNSGIEHLADICYSSPIVKVINSELGVTYMQSVNGGAELTRELSLIGPCKKNIGGVLSFDVGDQVVSFSAETGDLIRISERSTHPQSASYNIYHTGKFDPLKKSIEVGSSSHVVGSLATSDLKMDNLILSTDSDYVPKPDEIHDIAYHRGTDEGVRRHLQEVTFRAALDPISPARFLAVLNSVAIDKLNLDRHKRQERDAIPARFWPYETHTLPARIPNSEADHQPISQAFRRRRLKRSTEGTSTENGVFPQDENDFSPRAIHKRSLGGSGLTPNDQRKLPQRLSDTPHKDFVINDLRLRFEAFKTRFAKDSILELVMTVFVWLILVFVCYMSIITYANRRLLLEYMSGPKDSASIYAAAASTGRVRNEDKKHTEVDQRMKTLYHPIKN